MTVLLIVTALMLLLAVSLPYWLPSAVVGLRVRIFTLINGQSGLQVPGDAVDASRFKWLYSQRAARGRSRGAALSDLFWYWLSPGPEMHQEHIESGERYDKIASMTRRILAVPRRSAEELAQRCATRLLSELPIRDWAFVRLRDVMMPIWADFYYEIAFLARCPPQARQLIVENAKDVVTALKCCGLRHMDRRARLTQFLMTKLAAGEFPHKFPDGFTREEQAFYLQGTFFNTAVVQMSEGMTHLLLAIAQHPEVQDRLKNNPHDKRYLELVITETLRLYPLFGISHRITSKNIALDEHTMIPKGSVLCFNHPTYHQLGYENPECFIPERWLRLSTRKANYIPFGVAANRPCPAHGIALVTMLAVTRVVLERFNLYSSVSHPRSLPSRGPCLWVSRSGQCQPGRRALLLAAMRLGDRWEDVYRSLTQLVLGTYMVWEARRLRLCQRYFEAQRSTVAGGSIMGANVHTPSTPQNSSEAKSSHTTCPRGGL